MYRHRQQGKGVKGAQVYLNGDLVTRTDDQGKYTLESVRTGEYHIDVKADRIHFETTSLTISPQTPRLPHIVASRFVLCDSILLYR